MATQLALSAIPKCSFIHSNVPPKLSHGEPSMKQWVLQYFISLFCTHIHLYSHPIMEIQFHPWNPNVRPPLPLVVITKEYEGIRIYPWFRCMFRPFVPFASTFKHFSCSRSTRSGSTAAALRLAGCGGIGNWKMEPWECSKCGWWILWIRIYNA